MGFVFVPLLVSLASVVVMLFFTLGDGGLLTSALQNAGHFLLFLALTYYHLSLFKEDSLRHFSTHAKLVIALLALGAMVEAVQSYMPNRIASLDDFLLDAAGIETGYLLFIITRTINFVPVLMTIALTFMTIVMSVLATKPVLKLAAYHILKKGPSALISFSDSFVESTISVTGGTMFTLVEAPTAMNRPTHAVLRVDISEGNYGGVIFHDTSDIWAEGNTLVFDVYNDSQRTREMALRIHDRDHNNDYQDRYNMKLSVKPGINTYKIPIQTIRSSFNGEFSVFLTDLELVTL